MQRALREGQVFAEAALALARLEAIPPDAERQFAARMEATTIEVASSHLPMVSHPTVVADLIKTAADVVARQLQNSPR
jgi:hypothetical protein